MKTQNDTVSNLWLLPEKERVDTFERMYQTVGVRLFALFPSSGCDDWTAKCVSLRNAPCLNKRPQTIQTVAFFIERYVLGGTERCISYLMPLFQSLGYRVLLITDQDTSMDVFPVPEGVKRLVFGNENGVFASSQEDRCAKWESFIHENQIDAVYYAHGFQDVSLVDFLAIRAAGAYVLYHFHFCFTAEVLVGNAETFLAFTHRLKFADTVIGLSKADERFFKLCQCRAHYLPNKCFFDLPARYKTSVSSRLNCLWCARFSKQKQPLDVIPVFAKIREKVPNATLTILGDARQDLSSEKKNKRRMLRQAKALNCTEAITWTGFQEHPQQYYERADIFLSTSLYEGFPLVFIEAYAYGVPIVSYEMPYLESLKNPIAARTVPQGDQQAMADAAVELLTQPDTYHEAAMAARSFAEFFMAFDQGAAWKKVIEELPQPYTPDNSEDESSLRIMLETLLRHNCWAFTQEKRRIKKLYASLEWRIGSTLLFVPNQIGAAFKYLRKRLKALRR